jgi:hypothetical protein
MINSKIQPNNKLETEQQTLELEKSRMRKGGQLEPLVRQRHWKTDLFGDIPIRSIGFNQDEIIENILFLHSVNNFIDCDPTYSLGNFYKGKIKEPIHKFDINPQMGNIIQANANNLPLERESIFTIIFDPPFIFGGNRKLGNKIAKRFSVYNSWDEMLESYAAALREFYRILKPKGIVIFKCQDIADNYNYFTHFEVMRIALKEKFYPKDLFVFLARNKEDITNYNNGNQKHARKYHSYFWVFQKTKCNVKYLVA